nr:hypothetical protein [Sedimentibacter sp.]
MLLIITNKTDLTSDYLILKLIERNIPYLRLNTEEYGDKFEIDISFSDDVDSAILKLNGKEIFIKDITGVYFRRPELPNLENIVSASEIKFAQREMETLFSGYFRLLDYDKWLNHPKYIFSSNNKIEQLSIAKQIGFAIPNTIITKDENTIRLFIENEKSIIAKAIKHGFYSYEDKVYLAFTQEIDENYVENIKDYLSVPMIFQKKINKEYDIRINVIGDNVFATAILSQDNKMSQIDWRVWDVCEKFDLKHEAIKLPFEIEKKCIEINKYFKLNFSAIDMVLDKEGNYIFLEINPNGQWAWIEEKLGYPIRDAIIDFF